MGEAKQTVAPGCGTRKPFGARGVEIMDLEYFLGGRLGLLAPSQAGYGAGAMSKAAASAERLLVRWGPGGQGANVKAAEGGVRFGQTIWLSCALGHTGRRERRG